MHHVVKPARKHRRRGLRWGFALAGVWGLALCAVLALGAGAENSAEALTVQVHYRGRSLYAAPGLTGRETLAQLGLELTAEDEVTPDPDTVLDAGAVLTVVRRQKTRETYTISLTPETEYRLDDTLPWGQEAELFGGTVGQMRCVAEVTYINGVEESREILEKELLRSAEPRIVAIGTREDTAPVAENGCLWLSDGQMLTYTAVLTVEATAFTSTDPGCLPGAAHGSVAADPALIPEGSRLFIVTADGTYTYGPAQATASTSLTGSRVDLYMDAEACEAFGRRECKVYVLGEG